MTAHTELNVYHLVIEVTRRCNMSCEHCLRGDAQNMDISHKTIDDILDAVDNIGSVTFTGGEPSLNLDVIEYFFQQAEARGKLPQSFYVVTNGLANQMELATLLMRWYMKMEDKEMCGVAQSIDQFHDDVEPSPIKALAFYSSGKERQDDIRHAATWILSAGRANTNGLGTVEYRPDNSYDALLDALSVTTHEQVTEMYLECTLYVAANGNVVADCDMAYDDIDDDALCDIVELRDVLCGLAKRRQVAC